MADISATDHNDQASGSKQVVTYLSDYQAPVFLIDRIDLTFDIWPGKTIVKSLMTVLRNREGDSSVDSLLLDGEQLKLLSIKIDGSELPASNYTISDHQLVLHHVPDAFELLIETAIDPAKNLALEGLYLSDGMYCTQCEAQGFRRITYYLDRPDVMAVFSTTIIADKARYPVLLSNGNCEGQGDTEDGRHWAKWRDPFRKPCYLFALVAGDLAVLEDSFTTCSGREVALKIFAEDKDLPKCTHAMTSLKNAMRWDESTYGCEYDLDLYMIAAVDFFNMGAMENKGLNIFNTSCVLADQRTQTDASFQRVEAVVAHEYFHNWSGNRVTCRDWFQLSLKEGLTVFRDACFSADMNSVTVKRIEDVNLLRSAQFAEDAGPLAHPVRPESYIEISNFYTLTIYEKGAEVIRMMQQLLGADNYRKGTDLYFARHDGQAVTCEDFVVAMEDASGKDLGQFRRWYSQAGTPTLRVQDVWDQKSRCYRLTITQSCAPTPGQRDKEPFVIPVNVALFNRDSGGAYATERDVLVVTERAQTFSIENIDSRPVPSLLRGFSAPVNLEYNYSLDDLLVLLEHETDGFAQWDASRRYVIELLRLHTDGSELLNSPVGLANIKKYTSVLSSLLMPSIGAGERSELQYTESDAALVSEILNLPTYNYIIEAVDIVDIPAISSALELLKAEYVRHLAPVCEKVYRSTLSQLAGIGEYRPVADDIALRSLKNSCLTVLTYNNLQNGLSLAETQFAEADNMTDQFSALSAIVNSQSVEAELLAGRCIERFYQQWQHENLVVNQWFRVQAASLQMGTIACIKTLLGHTAYDNTNPNKVRSLIGAFCMANPVHFHAEDGSGYELLIEEVLRLDTLNAQLAARLLAPIAPWRRFAEPNKSLMQQSLNELMQRELSADVFEIVSKSLQ